MNFFVVENNASTIALLKRFLCFSCCQPNFDPQTIGYLIPRTPVSRLWKPTKMSP